MTEHWLHYYSVLSRPGWSIERLAQDVEARTVMTLRLVLKNGKIRKNWPCEGGCNKKNKKITGSYPLYGYSIAYRGKDYDRPYGIQRSLVGLCRDCMKAALRACMKEAPE